MEGKESYLTPLLVPALASGEFPQDRLKNEDVNLLVDEITLWSLKDSKPRIIKQNQYIRDLVSKGSLGMCLAFFNRHTDNIEFSFLFIPTWKGCC